MIDKKQKILDDFLDNEDKDLATARLMNMGWDRKTAEDIVWAWDKTKHMDTWDTWPSAPR